MTPAADLFSSDMLGEERCSLSESTQHLLDPHVEVVLDLQNGWSVGKLSSFSLDSVNLTAIIWSRTQFRSDLISSVKITRVPDMPSIESVGSRIAPAQNDSHAIAHSRKPRSIAQDNYSIGIGDDGEGSSAYLFFVVRS